MQAKSYAACELLLVSLDFSENLEEGALILLWDTYSGVFHSSNKKFGVVIVIQLQLNRALICEFDGVLHQVDENLSDPLSIY